MSDPMTQAQWRSALTAEGVRFREHAGWTEHNRNSVGRWGPVHGVMIHHTAGTDSLALVWSGRSDLPGPLAHAHLSKQGIATMVSSGRANHAGAGAQNAYDAVVGESATHPSPGPDYVDGNRYFYGLEAENLGNGSDPWPRVQTDQMVRWAAAICRHYGWSSESVIGHKEWTRRKVDPVGFTMGRFRELVQDRLDHAASWSPGDDSKETPVADETPNENPTYQAVAEADAIPAPKNHPDYAENKYWTLESYVRFIAEELIRQRSDS